MAGATGKFWFRLATPAAALIALVVVTLWFDSASLGESFRHRIWSFGTLHYADFEEKVAARGAADWHVGIGPARLLPEADAPELSPLGGFYADSVAVAVKLPATEGAVRCSTDGSIPTERNESISAVLTLAETTTLRCRSFQHGNQPSPTATQTYFVGTGHTLPVLAVTVSPEDLWSPYSGIYVRFRERGREWERFAHVEYRTHDGAGDFAIEGRLRIHGNFSRVAPKKSMRFYFVPTDLQQVDPRNPLTWPDEAPRRAVVFGARELGVNRDELFQEIYRQSGGIAPINHPVFVYLNGEPWGIYYLRERITEDFLKRTLGDDEYDLLYIEPGLPHILAGDGRHWRTTRRFFQEADFSDPASLAHAAELIDLDDFTNYWLYNIYAANFDWPHHNSYVFRSRTDPQARWRWISWDADATFDYRGFGLHHDTIAWATRTELRNDLRFNADRGRKDSPDQVASTLFAARLLTSPAYRERFFDQLIELIDTRLTADFIESELRTLHGELENDLAADWDRWVAEYRPGQVGKAVYQEEFQSVLTFARERPQLLRAFVQQHREAWSRQ